MSERDKMRTFKNEREHWIELLRIISMFWIILFHFADHGTIDMTKVPLSVNWLVLAIARAGGGIGNCIFVLISGYLLYNKDFRMSRVITLWIEVEFYSVISYVLSIAFGIVPWQGTADFIKSIFPIIGKSYWFISSYLLMYFLSPFLNHFIRNTDYKKHLLCVTVLLCCFSLPQSLPRVHWMGSEGSIEIFVLLYLIGAFIKKYDVVSRKREKIVAITTVIFLGELASEVVIKAIAPEYFTFFVWPMNKISVIGISVLIFGTMKGTAISLPTWGLRCAQSVFGVYLIHIGRMEKWFFERTFDISYVYEKGYFAVALVCYALIIFTLCILVDQFRIFCIEHPTKPLICKLSNRIEQQLCKIENYIDAQTSKSNDAGTAL